MVDNRPHDFFGTAKRVGMGIRRDFPKKINLRIPYFSSLVLNIPSKKIQLILSLLH